MRELAFCRLSRKKGTLFDFRWIGWGIGWGQRRECFLVSANDRDLSAKPRLPGGRGERQDRPVQGDRCQARDLTYLRRQGTAAART